MLKNTAKNNQPNLFHSPLSDMLDMNDPLIALSHETELVKFRQRIGKEGAALIFRMSVRLHGKAAGEKQVIADTTVQENNITYPTDGKMAIKIINFLHKIAKQEGIQLRRTYMKEIKSHRIALRFFSMVPKHLSSQPKRVAWSLA